MRSLLVLASLCTTLVGCRSAYVLESESNWRGIDIAAGRSIETALSPIGANRWLLYEQSEQGLNYTVLVQVAGKLSAIDSFSLAGLCHDRPAIDPSYLSARLVNNPISQRPVFPAFVDAYAGDPIANVSGGKSDSSGLAQVPRIWKPKTALRDEPPTSAPVDTTPIRLKANINGRDTIITIRPGRTRQSPVPDLGLAHTLHVKASGVVYSFALDTALLKRDVVVSLGIHTRYNREPVALKLKKGRLLLTWGNRQRELQASGVGIPAWCGWSLAESVRAKQ